MTKLRIFWECDKNMYISLTDFVAVLWNFDKNVIFD